jgi:protein tyrosine phosphatase
MKHKKLIEIPPYYIDTLHFTGWPDFGVPDNANALNHMVMGLRQLNPNMTVVHCSAGVGRTGTLLAISRIMDEIDCEVQFIDVFATVLALRKDRCFMVNF